MKPEQYFTFSIQPKPVISPPRPGNAETMKYQDFVKYKKVLASLAKAKRFKLNDSFKVIFILPMGSKLTPKEMHDLVGEPHTTGNSTLTRLIEGVRQALLGQADIARVEASKYWGLEPKIIIRNIVAPDFDYLRQIK